MPVDLDWGQIILRLVLTVIAAGAIGFEREANSRPAGLRTTVLVALAACFAMLQANALLNLRGKTPDSYVVLDLMRLPLGILSGMGFIGAGAILRKENLVIGVTTAATLWFVTVMGLCFGGGELGLGIAAALLGLFVLRGLKWLEHRWQHTHRATLCLVSAVNGPRHEEVASTLKAEGYSISNVSASYSATEGTRKVICEVNWRGAPVEAELPKFLQTLAKANGVTELNWNQEKS